MKYLTNRGVFLILTLAMCLCLLVGICVDAWATTEGPAAAAVCEAGVQLTVYSTLADAAANCSAGQYVKLLADVSENLTVSADLYLDLNGFDVNGTVTVASGTFYGMDSATDDYDCTDGYGTVSNIRGSYATAHKTEVTGEILRYLTVTEGDGVSFHRIYLGMQSVYLKPNVTGMGYKAIFCGDEKGLSMLDETEAMGYRLWVDGGVPQTRYMGKSAFCAGRDGNAVTLGIVNFNLNKQADTKVYAVAYLKLADGTVLESAEYSYTFQELVTGVDAALLEDAGAYSQDRIHALYKMYCKDEAIMTNWGLVYIPNAHLFSQYDVDFYSTMNLAVTDINSGTIGENADSRMGNAAAGVYVDNGKPIAVLLQDHTEEEMLQLCVDMAIHLDGHRLTALNETAVIIASGNVVIDGSDAGSEIVSSGKIMHVGGGKLTINGGTYTANTSGAGTSAAPAGAITVDAGATLDINDACVYANDSNNGTVAAIIGGSNSTVIANGCTLEAASQTALNVSGVRSSGHMTLEDCSVMAKSDYTGYYSGANGQYKSHSRGIYSNGTLELYNCYVWGGHSGITFQGSKLHIDGGTYEGYGHGGLYCAKAGNDMYICNATVRWADMIDGYIADDIAGTNGAGMYIGSASNMTVYVDNCDIYGTRFGIAMRYNGGERNNTLFVSNSRIDAGEYTVRIYAATHSAYLGVGNNFDAASTSAPDRCIITEESYVPKE